jgi:ubiquinol-cytochrome c reductase iron-sulfur subunit
MSVDQKTPEEMAEQDRREQVATRVAALSFGVSILAALGLVAVYVGGGDTQLEGLLLTIAFGGVAVGLGVWVKVIIGHELVVEPRHPLRSTPDARQAFEEEFDDAVDAVGSPDRRKFLGRLLAGAGASMGLALTVPFLSLGPIFSRGAQDELFETAWTSGKRLVTPEGQFLRPEDFTADQIATVFPADAGTPADSQAVLINLQEGRLVATAMPEPSGVVGDLVCYSKLCTHAGCPVGLFRAREGELICPCHQSLFDVNAGAAVKSGPAGRPLPQLPIGVDAEGYLVATGDFTAPVGPSFWNMTSRRGE